MAGLCAAARARELGAKVTLLEKGDRPGGSMLLSSGVVWRFRSIAEFRAECPLGNPRLQQELLDRLDEGVAWLQSLGAPVLERGENRETVFVRFDTRGLTEALVRAAGSRLLRAPLTAAGREADAVVLATGGFQGDRALVARHITPEAPELVLRSNPWSAGDGLRAGLERGAGLSAGLGEFFGRNLPAPPARLTPDQFVRTAQLYADAAVVLNEQGLEFVLPPYSFSQNEVVQATARQPGARAWYLLDARGFGSVVRAGPVRSMVDAARAAGGAVLEAGERRGLADAMGIGELPHSPRLSEPPFTAVHVVAGITHTIGGVAIDPRARVLDEKGAPVEGLFAAGADAGGISTGGYASGLASALVFGRIAAETALG